MITSTALTEMGLMLQYDFQSSIGYWILCSGRSYERCMQQLLTPAGITHRQCQVLAWLAHDGPLSQVELAERMSIEPPTLVRVLDRMERDGLLIREACPSDRRIKLIRVLPKARPVWKKIVRCAERARELASQGLTEKQLETLRILLDVVKANLEAATDVPAPTAVPETAAGGKRKRRADFPSDS